MIVNIHAAKTNLSKLIARAEAGEEVIIARAGKPVARLAPLGDVTVSTVSGVEEQASLPSWIGSMRGQIWMAPDFDALDEEFVREMEEGPDLPAR